MDNMSNNKEGLVKYVIKYLYPKDQISDEQAKRDFINTIFSHIALTSITNYNVMRSTNEDTMGCIKMSFDTYGKRLKFMFDESVKFKSKINFDTGYKYRLYLEEINTIEDTDIYANVYNDKDGICTYTNLKNKTTFRCPKCNGYIFKHLVLRGGSMGWDICPSCHEIITVKENNERREE
mgnify:CR=1 FL=1